MSLFPTLARFFPMPNSTRSHLLFSLLSRQSLPRPRFGEAVPTAQPLLSKCEYFTVYKIDIENSAEFNADETSFESILVLEGDVTLRSADGDITLKKGETAFLPAGLGKYTIEGKSQAILTRID